MDNLQNNNTPVYNNGAVPPFNNGYYGNNYGNYNYQLPNKPRHKITKPDIAGFIIGFVLMFAVFQVGIFNGFNFGFSLSVTVLFTFGFIYVWNSSKKNTVFSLLMYLLSVVLIASYSFNNDGFIKFIGFIFLLFASSFALSGISGNVNVKESTYLLAIDSTLVAFKCFFTKFSVMVRSFKEHLKASKSRAFVSSALGVVIAFPVICLVMGLLSSTDVAFESLVTIIFDNVATFIFAVILSVVFTPFIFSHFFALKKGEGLRKKPLKKLNARLSAVTANTFLAMISVVYCIYLISQLAYITKAFAFLLPEGYSASQFARDGFFQMAAIAFINLLILTLTMVLIRRKDNNKVSALTKALLTFLCLFTEFYIATSFVKMAKYISMYGLTRLRVLTSVFMIMLAIIFLVLLVRLFVRKIPYIKVITFVCALTVILISVVDINTVIAEYNYKAYKDGKVHSIDVDLLESLGINALPVIIELTEDKNPDVAFQAKGTLLHLSEDIYIHPFDNELNKNQPLSDRTLYRDVFDMNIISKRAKESLDEFIEKNPDFLEEYDAEYLVRTEVAVEG